MTGDSGCGAWPQPLLSCTTSLSIAMFVNVLFCFPGRCPGTASQSYGFFLFRQTFPQKNCWKSCEAGVGPGPLPGFLLKSECKVTNLRRNFQMFLQLFLRKISPRHATPCKPTGYNHKKKLTKPYPITTSQFKASIATISLPTKPPKNYTIKYLNNLFYVKNTPI